ncbi:hypothetical protein E2C01_011963 [Portunus trituberculatus]|uniref:Uncharacterized protein n=1 Tax=Portunus trituberculatus TaxID=210409 RepID=A0A5B7DD84_PORTR|nr:hypothetical protein [Portunus trituberculatus]
MDDPRLTSRNEAVVCWPLLSPHSPNPATAAIVAANIRLSPESFGSVIRISLRICWNRFAFCILKSRGAATQPLPRP